MFDFVLFADFWNSLLGVLLFGTAIFLILVVLVQRGRGGGLAGALGGMGGQSAFGAKAGDLFTRITMVVAFLWIVLCVACVIKFNPKASQFEELGDDAPKQRPSMTVPADNDEPE